MIFTGSMEDLLDSYRLIKGKLRDLTVELEKSIIGLRKTDMGFDGLISTKAAAQYKNYIIDNVKIDDVIVRIGKGGRKYE